MKISEIINNVKEHVSDWKDNPFVKIFELYRLYRFTYDSNVKFKICKEILEDIDKSIKEFNSNHEKKTFLNKVKLDVTTYINSFNQGHL